MAADCRNENVKLSSVVGGSHLVTQRIGQVGKAHAGIFAVCRRVARDTLGGGGGSGQGTGLSQQADQLVHILKNWVSSVFRSKRVMKLESALHALLVLVPSS